VKSSNLQNEDRAPRRDAGLVVRDEIKWMTGFFVLAGAAARSSSTMLGLHFGGAQYAVDLVHAAKSTRETSIDQSYLSGWMFSGRGGAKFSGESS